MTAPDWLQRLRPQPSWLPRVSIGLGIGSTIAMNVTAGSRGGLGGALIGGLIALGFLVALEMVIWLVGKIVREPWGWVWCVAAGIPLLGLAAITGIVSYLHALTVVEWTGSTGLVAHLIPLVPDQLIVCGSVALMAVAFVVKRTVQPPDRRRKADLPPPPDDEKTDSLPPPPDRKRKPPVRPKPVRPGARVVPPLAPEPGDPALEVIVQAHRDGTSFRDFAALHDMTRWRAERLLKHAAMVSANGHATASSN